MSTLVFSLGQHGQPEPAQGGVNDRTARPANMFARAGDGHPDSRSGTCPRRCARRGAAPFPRGHEPHPRRQVRGGNARAVRGVSHPSPSRRALQHRPRLLRRRPLRPRPRGARALRSPPTRPTGRRPSASSTWRARGSANEARAPAVGRAQPDDALAAGRRRRRAAPPESGRSSPSCASSSRQIARSHGHAAGSHQCGAGSGARGRCRRRSGARRRRGRPGGRR